MRTLVGLSIALAVVGCKGKPKHQAQAPTNVEKPTGSAGDHTMKPAPDLTLPTGDGTRPKQSAKPIDKDTMTKLTKLTFPGFNLSVRGQTDKVMQVRQLTSDHPKIAATITIQQCSDCVAMDLGKWKPREDTLKLATVTEDLRKQPDFVWELGNTQLNGQDMIFTYQLGQIISTAGGSWTDGYGLHYNDGVNEIIVFAEYKDDPVKDVETLSKMAPKADLEKVAKSFMDVYTHAW